MPWSDLGSFADLYRVAREAGNADEWGNVTIGDAMVLGSRGNYVDAAGRRLVVVIGGEELAVIDTPDALLICPLARVQEVAKVVSELRSRGRPELL
jgi:mannose-1-phosphate guanylyltransferase